MRRSAPPADKALDFDAEGVKCTERGCTWDLLYAASTGLHVCYVYLPVLARLNLQAAALGGPGGRLYNNLDQVGYH